MKENRGLPVNPDAVVVHGKTQGGRDCLLIDNTASVSNAELDGLLLELVRNRRFGLQGLSAAGGNTIDLDRPEFTHLQINERLYRLIVSGYEACLEEF